jgi:acyl carrier protein
MTTDSAILNTSEAELAQLKLAQLELAQLVVETLNLDQVAADIDPDAPLYGEEGLGLDSIDMLEISLTVSQRYGVKLRADEENNGEIFRSLRSLNAYIQAHREP